MVIFDCVHLRKGGVFANSRGINKLYISAKDRNRVCTVRGGRESESAGFGEVKLTEDRAGKKGAKKRK